LHGRTAAPVEWQTAADCCIADACGARCLLKKSIRKLNDSLVAGIAGQWQCDTEGSAIRWVKSKSGLSEAQETQEKQARARDEHYGQCYLCQEGEGSKPSLAR
jgi:hypothetical protein